VGRGLGEEPPLLRFPLNAESLQYQYGLTAAARVRRTAINIVDVSDNVPERNTYPDKIWLSNYKNLFWALSGRVSTEHRTALIYSQFTFTYIRT
jgi:hypothetical protein